MTRSWTVDIGGHPFTVDKATTNDVAAIVALLKDDPLGSLREGDDLAPYLRAFEAVRVAADLRGSGLGTALFDWAHDFGRAHGASLVELTTDRSRTDAHRFYERLGYSSSHLGFKRDLDSYI